MNFDWTQLNNPEIRNQFAITLKNRYQALNLETDASTNTKYNNFIEANQYAAKHCIPTKEKIKQTYPWENEAVLKARRKLKAISGEKNRNNKPDNVEKTKTATKPLENTYQTEQQKYMQNQVDEIKSAADNRKSSLVWIIINKISGRKKTNISRLRAQNDDERLGLWKTRFPNDDRIHFIIWIYYLDTNKTN